MAFDRQDVHEPIGNACIRSCGGVRTGGSGLQALDHIAVIGRKCCETSTGIRDRAVVETNYEQEVIGRNGGNGTTSERGTCADGRAGGLDRIGGINIGVFELVKVKGAVGSSAQSHSDVDGRAASDNVLGIESLRFLRRAVPAGGPDGRSVNISFVVGNGGNGERLVAPLDGHGDEISRDASSRESLRNGIGPREHGSLRLLDKGDRRWGSRRLSHCGSYVREVTQIVGRVEGPNLIAVGSPSE